MTTEIKTSQLDPESQSELRRQLAEKYGITQQLPDMTPPNIPWYMKPLEFVGKMIPEPIQKGFEWIHEKMEKPWAAAITAPFSPGIAGGQPGENWLQRELREYEAWESPRFAKGAAEFTMPLWWIPVGGAVAKGGGLLAKAGLPGARALGKVGAGISAAERLPGELLMRGAGRGIRAVVPSQKLAYGSRLAHLRGLTKEPPELLTQKLKGLEGDYVKPLRTIEEHMATEFPLSPDKLTQFAQRLGENPIGRKIVGSISRLPIADADVSKLLIGHIQQRVEGGALAHTAVSPLEVMNPKRLFGYGADFRVPEAMVKKAGSPRGILDVVENPTWYNLNPEQLEFVNKAHQIIGEMTNNFDILGIPYKKRWLDPEGVFAPRHAAGRRMAENKITKARRPLAEGEMPLKGEKLVTELKGGMLGKPRIYKSQEAGIKTGVLYDDVAPSIEEWLRESYNKISTLELREYVDSMVRAAGGKITPLERMDQILRAATVEKGLQVSGLKETKRIIQDMIMGKKPHPATIGALAQRDANLAAKLQGLPVAVSEAEATLRNKVVNLETRLNQAKEALAKKDTRTAVEVTSKLDIGKELGTEEKILQGYKAMPEDVQNSFRASLNDILESANEVMAQEGMELAGIREFLSLDPVANYSVQISGKTHHLMDVFQKAIAPHTRRTKTGKIVEVKGTLASTDFPEGLTKHQARLFLQGREIRPSVISPKGKVKWEYILDELASQFGFESEDKLIAHIQVIKKMQDKLDDLVRIVDDSAKGVDDIQRTLNMIDEAVPPPVIPKAMEGMPEAGMQARFTPEGKIVQERFTPTGKGEVTQVGMEDYLKLQEARGVKPEVPVAPKPTVPTAPLAKVTPISRVVANKERNVILKGLRKDVKAQLEAARDELLPLQREYKHAKDIAALPEGWEGTIRSGAFSGHIYPYEISNAMNEYFGKQTSETLQKLEKIAAVPRTAMVAFDFGVTQLHLLPMLFRNPQRWGKSFKAQFEYFVKPENFHNWYEAERAVIAEMNQYGIQVGGMSAEFVEALAKGGYLRRGAEKAPVVGAKLGKGIERFEASFTGALSVGQVETWKALRPLAKTPQEIRDVAAYVRNVTGTLDSRLLGIPAGQRAAEAVMMFFAPRYTRSIIALWRTAATGGMMQKEAIRTLGQLAAGAGAIYYAACLLKGEEPHLDPTKGNFMTLTIGDTNVGLGSGHMAVFRFLANTIDTAVTEPSKFAFNPLNAEDWRDNSFARFFRSRTSVLTGTAIDILTGRTFIGEPLDSVPDVLREEVLGQMVPFWLASYLTDQPRPGAASLPAEMFGMRAWTKTYYQRRDDLRDSYAMQDYGAEWSRLNRLQQKEIVAKYSDLAEVTQQAEAQTATFGGVDEQTWFKYKDEMGNTQEWQEGELWKLQKGIDDGVLSGRDFRLKVNEIYAQARAVRERTLSRDEFATVREWFDKEKDMSDLPMEDVAYQVYMDMMYGEDMEDQYGFYDFDKAKQNKREFIARFGIEKYQYVQDLMKFGKDVPPSMKLLYKARDILEPYWGIQDTLLRQYNIPADVYKTFQRSSGRDRANLIRRYPQLPIASSRINMARHNMLRQNNEMERYYRLFYAY